ncbi:MAG: hypothetical protein P4M09_31315 [Devosia sp.]|nr:hypothetical protein [Devosia sp.]
MNSQIKSVKPTRWVAAFAMGIAMGVSGVSGAQAESAAGGDHVQHFFDCFGLMVTNGTQHAQECGPNPYVPSDHLQLAPAGGGGVVCDYVTMIDLPLATRPQLASLGDGLDYLPLVQHPAAVLVGMRRPRCHAL